MHPEITPTEAHAALERVAGGRRRVIAEIDLRGAP
jgi:hypothetical protein